MYVDSTINAMSTRKVDWNLRGLHATGRGSAPELRALISCNEGILWRNPCIRGLDAGVDSADENEGEGEGGECKGRYSSEVAAMGILLVRRVIREGVEDDKGMWSLM